MNANLTVLGVSLLVWGLLFIYVWRLERRIKDLERK
jgi:heme/copper-type cytochrome/quinol oxidase subunit 2